MRLSIIIALYNTEIYIEKCIRSIYAKNNMPMSSFEVLVINDGSTDNSPSIVSQLQEEYSNIVLINKENGGQSTARNVGFNLVKGKYFFCLDSDDFINDLELIKALEICEVEDLDLLPISLKRFDENFNLLKQKEDNYTIFSKPITGGELMNRFVISGSMCRYLYKTTILKTYGLKLTEGIFHEDEEFIVKFISYSKRIIYQKNSVYNQVVRSNSTMNNDNKDHRIRLLNDLTHVIIALKDHRKNFKSSSLEYVGISKKIEQLSISVFLRMKNDNLKFTEIKAFIMILQKADLYPLSATLLPLKFKIGAKFFNCALFNKLYYN